MLRNNKIAVLIPCYNEAQTINKVICDWRTVLNEAYQDVQIYVYDNNSTDKTAEIAEKSWSRCSKREKTRERECSPIYVPGYQCRLLFHGGWR